MVNGNGDLNKGGITQVSLEEMTQDSASFRDPASTVYVGGGRVHRLIRPSYYDDYRHLMRSGLYDDLVGKGLLIPHQEIEKTYGKGEFIVIEPEIVPLVSYPYEWSFMHLKEAAAVTLAVNRLAMEKGMMLKDASAYNLQFLNGHMCFIDTCSFTRYTPGMPWGAYSQFLRHFVCPLLLMKYSSPQDAKLSQLYIDGIPVRYVSKRMPLHTLFSFGMWAHLRSQSLNFTVNPRRKVSMSQYLVDTLLNNLAKFVKGLKYKTQSGGWIDYEDMGSYNSEGLKHKAQAVRELIRASDCDRFLDIGCNVGAYSQIALTLGRSVVAIDSDHDCINQMWSTRCDQAGLTPLVVDICNPSPGIGWYNEERGTFWERLGEVDCILALAILHHLCIKENVNLCMVASVFAAHASDLIIEWVPPEDEKAQMLMGLKTEIPEYNHNRFLEAFGRFFRINSEVPIKGSGRIIYYMERKF